MLFAEVYNCIVVVVHVDMRCCTQHYCCLFFSYSTMISFSVYPSIHSLALWSIACRLWALMLLWFYLIMSLKDCCSIKRWMAWILLSSWCQLDARGGHKHHQRLQKRFSLLYYAGIFRMHLWRGEMERERAQHVEFGQMYRRRERPPLFFAPQHPGDSDISDIIYDEFRTWISFSPALGVAPDAPAGPEGGRTDANYDLSPSFFSPLLLLLLLFTFEEEEAAAYNKIGGIPPSLTLLCLVPFDKYISFAPCVFTPGRKTENCCCSV